MIVNILKILIIRVKITMKKKMKKMKMMENRREN
jgi:hypothetical protein